MTRIPWCDEAWFACAGFHLAAHGKLVTPVIAPAPNDPKTMGLDQHTYWVMPLQLLFQAGCYRLFGFSLLTLRAGSIFWGFVALCAWLVIMRILADDARAALLTAGLLGTGYIFILQATSGRMDMMSAALSDSALAAYLLLRRRNLNLAVLCSHSLVTLSGLTHPNGGLLGLAGVFLLMWSYDAKSLRWRHAALAAIPYLIGAAGWGLYILEDPRLFLVQFGGNASGRLTGFLAPWQSLRREIVERYLYSFGLQPGVPAANRIKLIFLLGYLGGVGGTLSVAALRRRPGVRVLLALTAIHLLFLTFFESSKQPVYLIYAVPFFCALMALWILWLPAKRVVALTVVVFIGLQLAAVARVVMQNQYGRAYRPAADFLLAHGGATATVMGEPQLGFALGFDGGLIDDPRLGYYSHKAPAFIVVGDYYRSYFETLRREEPAVAQHVAALLASRYQPVFENGVYTIYARRPFSRSGK